MSNLDGMRAATTVDDLEAAIQAPFKHSYRGPLWSRISKVRVDAGNRIVAEHPQGRFVPVLGRRHALCVAGETYRVGYGGNSTGVRYAWYAAEMWSLAVLQRHGFTKRASKKIWDCWPQYPHHALRIVLQAQAGGHLDPILNEMQFFQRSRPVCVSADEGKRRASKPCPRCAGTVWDWGAGHESYNDFINWYCDRSGCGFTEYLKPGELVAIRQRKEA